MMLMMHIGAQGKRDNISCIRLTLPKIREGLFDSCSRDDEKLSCPILLKEGSIRTLLSQKSKKKKKKQKTWIIFVLRANQLIK